MGCSVVLVLVLVLVLVQGGAAGTTWRVGGSKGWQLSVDFALWKQGKVFEVGDILLFSYNKSTENLLEVSAADYASCTTVAPIHKYTDGNSSVPLGNLTSRFFISGIPGHCVAGMTLQIQMGTQSPTPAPAPAPTPLSAPVPSPIPTSPLSTPPPLSQMSSPPPRPSSSAPPSFTVLSLAILLSMATSIGAALIL